MYINRLTIGFPYKIVYFNKKIKEFNHAAYFLEEVIFSHLPRKVNFDGYGYFNIQLNTNEFLIGKNKFIAGGQIVTYEINDYLFDLDDFLEKTEQKKFEFLLNTFEEGINIANEKLSIDIDKFNIAISESRKNGPNLKYALRISKNHKSRRLQVVFYRELNLKNEMISFQIVSKTGEILEEKTLNNESSIYELDEKYSKSKWIGNTLNIFDKSGVVTLEIDISTFL